MLIGAAAAQWNVAASECRAENSVITHVPSGRTVTFGQVAGAAARIEAPKGIKLKDPKDWKLVGRPQRRLEIIDKIQGKPIYGIDVRLPDMLHAAVIQSPVFKGKLKSVDASRIDGMRGIHKLVKLDNAVAVVADNWWRAKTALDALELSWDDGGNGTVSSGSIGDVLRGGLAARRCRRRTQERRCRGRPGAGRQAGRGRVRGAVSEPCHHGAAELHRANHPRPRRRRQGRNLGADAERRGVARCGRTGGRRAGAQRGGSQVHARRRFRPARPDPGLRVAGGQDRPRAGPAGQGAVDARRGHAPRLLPAGGHGQDDGRAGRRRDAGGLACADHRAPRSSE